MSRPARFAALALLASACNLTDGFGPGADPFPAPPAATPTIALSTGWTAASSWTPLDHLVNVFQGRSYGVAINAGGTVAGYTQGYFDGLFVEKLRATLWTGTTATQLAIPAPGHSSQISMAADINDAGVVVGSANVATATGACCTGLRAVIWPDPATVVELPALPGGTLSRALGINNLGQVAGVSNDAGGVHRAVIWDGIGKVPTIIPVPGATLATASALNDAGQVVGSWSDGLNGGGFRWSAAGGVELIGHLGGGTTDPTGINASGQVVGASTVASGDNHPFLWTPATGLQDLGLPPGASNAWARAINDAGQVAVTSLVIDPVTGDFHEEGWLWIEGTWVSLHDATLGVTMVADLTEDLRVAGTILSPADAFHRATRWQVTLAPLSNPWPFTGFFAPVDNAPTVNRAKAGSAIPIKFSLGGDRGLDIFAPGFPVSHQVACDNSAPVDAVEITAAAGQSGLSYDPVTDRYLYAWKTEQSWAGSCRRFTLRLADGSERWAEFRFTR